MKRFLFFMLLANLPLKGICLEYDYSFETSQNQIILQSILISVIDFSSEDKIRDQLNLWFQEGMPDIKQLVRLPDRGKIEVSVDVQEFENIEVNEDIRYNYSNILKITERSVYQIHPFTISDPAILGNNRIVSIHFPPFEISENLSDIRLIKRLEFRITVHPETGINEISDHKYYLNSSINRLLANLLGYAQNELDSELPFQPKAVVVLRNSPQLMGILQPWFEWKNEKGWELELLTEEDVPDWNRFEIRDELVRRYNEAENPFQYVVIVGDSEGPFSVPPGSAGIEGQGMYGAGDHAYSTLVGDDVLPDVGLGRISVEQLSELRTYVNKVLEYEKLAGDQGDWLSRGMVSAGSEVSGVSTIYLGRYARDLMLAGEYANVDTAWYNDGLGDVTPRSIDAINSGVGFYLYRGLVGHGLQQEHINNLQNAHMTPVVLDITCNTGDWASSFSISEAYMRSGTVNNPTGGIGAFSTATSYTLTRFNNALAAGAVEAAFRHKVEHLGDLVTGAKLNLWHNYQGHEDEQVENFSTWFNLMGDPTISFWTAIPRELTVEAPESLPLGRHSTTVRVMDSDGEPIENAWVTLYKTENQQPVVSRGISDFRGLATLAVDFAETGEITLTVSAQNYRPHQQIIQSQQAESDLEIVEFIVDDSNGNDNGIAESGEDILLKPVLRNSGNGNYADILVSYGFIDHPWYIVFNGELTIPAISAGEEIVADSGFFIGISPDLKDQHSMPIPFSLSYEAGIFHDTLFQTLSAPQLIFDGAEISEPLNPGAEATVRFRLKNIGHASSSPGEIVIGTQDQYLEIETEYNGLGEIGVGEIVLTPEFILRATGNSILGHMANVYLNAFDENGAIYRIEGQIPLGERSEYDPAGPDGRGYYAFDQVDQDYAQAPIFEWIEISPQAENPDYHGMVLDIQDYTRNQDDAVVMELPFTFRFYGERFNQVTITSNGYIALGDQAHLPTYRNWRIPAPLGPDYIIAPFWDDRRTSGGGHVVWYDDEAGNRVIIQWTGMTDFFDQNPCTFQLILYDRVEGHTTPTHDNEFLFQYSTLNPSDGHEEGNRFYTTGIQNGDHSDGLLLAYWNEMFPGTARIDSGSAILFTTRVEPNFWKLKEQQSNIPSEFSVLPAWPNPFNSTTNIRIALPEAADLTYHLYNILGEVVSTRELGHFTAGHYSIPLTPQSTSSGIYFVTLEASGRQINVQKLVLLK